MKSSLFSFLVLVSTGLLMSGCSSGRKVDASTPEVVRLSVFTAGTSSVPDVLEAVGTVRAYQTSQLSSQATGTITQVRVREGDHVHRGEVLATLDQSAPSAALDRAVATEAAAANELTAAESDLALAQSTLARYQILFDKQIISRQQFDEVKARQQSALAHRDLARASQLQAKAAVTEARAVLDFTRVTAPFAGIVTERRLDPGAMASPGLPILTVEDVSRYRLEASVNENDLRFVRLGQQVPVSIEALADVTLTGRVVQIVPAADPASRTFVVKLELDGNRAVRSGLFGHAQFSRGQKSALLVPTAAVVDRGQLHAAYVLDQSGIANLRYVTLGRTSASQIEILAGIQPGERVVAQPAGVNLSGKRIEAQE
jgi:RND family efflux transporter MFP subunit